MSAEDLSSPAQHLSSSHSSSTASLPQYSVPAPQATNGSKYSQLLCVIEELSKDIRPTYTGNKVCAERLKRAIIQARILVRECLMETDRAMRH